MAIIGTAYVHIRADDKYFESDVRKATAKIKNVTIQLKADVDLAKATKKIRDLRYRITNKDAVLKVDADVTKAEDKLTKLLKKFAKTDVEFNAVAKTTEANTALGALKTDMASTTANIRAVADTKAAEAQLAAAARNRTSNISANVDPKTRAALQGLFNTITGTISAEKIKGVLAGVAANFEGLAVKATMATTAIFAVGGALLTTAGNALSIAGDITEVIGLFGVMPAALFGLITTVKATTMAWKGFGEAVTEEDPKKAAEALAKLPPEAQKAAEALRKYRGEIQKPVQKAFWENMGTSLQDMYKVKVPEFARGMSFISGAMGRFTKETLETITGLGDMNDTFVNVESTIDNLAKGLEPAITALERWIGVGSTYLPQFGNWVSDLATKFGAWTKEAEETGKMTIWIDTAIQRVQEMASIIKSTTGIFSGLTTAARAAGAPGLTEMAESLRNIRDIVQGEPFQSRLITVLEGARDGVDKLKVGFKDLTDFIGESSTTIGIFLDEAGKIAGLTLSSVRTLFDGTGLGTGLHTAVESLGKLIDHIQPGIRDLGISLGIMGTIAGSVIEAFGPGLNQLFETIRKVLQEVQQGVIDVIPIFNRFIESIMMVVQGPLVFLADLLGKALELFADLPGGIQNVIMSLGLFMLFKNKLVGFFDPAQRSLSNLQRDAQSRLGAIQNIANGTGNGIRNSFNNAANDSRTAMERVRDNVVNAGRSTAEVGRNMAGEFSGIKNSISQAMSATSHGIKANMDTAAAYMPQKMRDIASSVTNGLRQIPAGFAEAARSINREFDPVRAGLRDLPENARRAGSDFKARFGEGLSNIGEKLAPADTALRRFADNTRNLAGQMHTNLGPAREAFTNLSNHIATASSNAMGQLGSGLRSAAGSLSGFLGGPWGIALMAATVLLGEFATQQAKAERQVDNLAAAFESSGGRIDSAVRKVISANLDMKASFFGLEFDSGMDIAKKIGVPLKDVTDAAAGVPGAMERVQKALGQTGNSATKSGTMVGTLYKVMGETAGPARGLFELAEKMGIGMSEGDKLNKVIGEQKAVMDEAKKKNEELAESLGIGTVASARMTANFDTLRDAASSVSDRVSALKDNIDLQNSSMLSSRDAARDHAKTMFDLEDSMKKLPGAADGIVDANGRMQDAFRGTLTDADGTFNNLSKQSIAFSEEMDAAATSVLNVGMAEMKKLQDAGATLPEAQAGAMKVMNEQTEILRGKLATLGFDAGQQQVILNQLGLNPEKLMGALVVNTKDAEAEVMRFELFKDAVLAGNWSVALEASTDQVKNAILTTDAFKKAYEEGGWEAVAKLKDETGKPFSELMTKIALAKDEAEVTTLLKAEFPDAHVFDNAKKLAEEYDMLDVKAALGVDDKVTVPAGIAKAAVMDFGGSTSLATLKAVDDTRPGLEAATSTMGTLPDVRRHFTAEDRTEEGRAKSQATMETLKDVIRKLEAENKTGTPTAEAQATLDSLKNVVRDLSANNLAGEGKNAAQRTVDSFKGKEAELTALDKATKVVQDVNNAKLANKSFSISALWDGVSEKVRSFFGFANGGILNGAGIQKFANGGIQMPSVKQYANGGVENHVAQIARGAWPVRVWAEPETGGEAYLPLHPSKRKRSLKILDEVAEMFGYSLVKSMSFDNGGIVKMSSKTPSMVSNSSSVTTYATTPAAMGASAPTIITHVHPSTGLDERQVADSVSENIYWKLTSNI